MAPADERSLALERLIARCAQRVRQVAGRHQLDAAAIDEVFQDVRIRIWKAFPDDPGEIDRLPASYVYRAASAAAVDFIRRARARRAHVSTNLDVVAATASADVDPPIAIGIKSDLSAALDELAPSRRPVVRMYLEGYDRTEIATMLGWTEAKVRNLLYRGLADLRAGLERRGIRPGETHGPG
jgi:RNA polymerase sigma-70 factor (ECF subfamily)